MVERLAIVQQEPPLRRWLVPPYSGAPKPVLLQPRHGSLHQDGCVRPLLKPLLEQVSLRPLLHGAGELLTPDCQDQRDGRHQLEPA